MFTVHLYTVTLKLKSFQSQAELNDEDFCFTFLALARQVFPRPIDGIDAYGKLSGKKYIAWPLHSQNEAICDAVACKMAGALALKQKRLAFTVMRVACCHPWRCVTLFGAS